VKRSRLIIGASIFAVVASCVVVYPQASRWYYVRVKGVKESIRKFVYLDSTCACLPEGYALAFIDSNNASGFIFLERMEYGQLDYVVKIFDRQTEMTQKGRLTKWRKWPWSPRSMQSKHVYIGDEGYPHFVWLPPYGFLYFDRSKILKVCLVPLTKVQEALDNQNSDQWIETDYVGDGTVGRGNNG
jgi:hypothetical protein